MVLSQLKYKLYIIIGALLVSSILVIISKDRYESVSNHDDNRYDLDRGRARTSDRIANIPPSKNPTILLERILRNNDSKIRPNDKEIFLIIRCPGL